MILFGNKLKINGGMYTTTLLITLGIFLFFSIYDFDIKVFKNKEKFYKNKVNMLLISNLMYKLKDNTRLLFLITILLSATLVAFTTTSTLVSSQGESSKIIFQWFTHIFQSIIMKRIWRTTKIRDTIKRYDYKELSFPILQYNREVLLNVKDYNKLSKELGLDKISSKLRKYEGIIIPSSNSQEHINSLKELRNYSIKI